MSEEEEVAEVQALVDRVRWVHPVAWPAEPTLVGYVVTNAAPAEEGPECPF